ncbi:MAG: hypothetical protein QXQ10_06810 [Nitrososphaerota archaeon]
MFHLVSRWRAVPPTLSLPYYGCGGLQPPVLSRSRRPRSAGEGVKRLQR